MLSCKCGRNFADQSAFYNHIRRKAEDAGDKDHKMALEIYLLSRGLEGPPGPNNEWMKDGTTELIDTIVSISLEPSPVAVSKAFGEEVICSYNSVSPQKSPRTIYVPGSPRGLLDIGSLLTPFRVPDDTSTSSPGVRERDLKKSLDPIFQSLRMTNSSFNFHDIDLVVDRTSLVKLHKFADQTIRQNFRLELSVIRNTLLILGCDKPRVPGINTSRPDPDWGMNLARHITAPSEGLEDGITHDRILLYRLGSLRCVVRNTAGACTIAGVAARTDVPAPAEGPAQSHGSIVVVPRGQPVPQSSIVTITTQSPSLSRNIPQLWFSRTSLAVVGTGRGGTFHNVRLQDMNTHLREWEIRHQSGLRKLVALLGRMRAVVKRAGGGSCVVVCERGDKSDEIKVFKMASDETALPMEVVDAFWRQEDGYIGEVN